MDTARRVAMYYHGCSCGASSLTVLTPQQEQWPIVASGNTTTDLTGYTKSLWIRNLTDSYINVGKYQFSDTLHDLCIEGNTTHIVVPPSVRRLVIMNCVCTTKMFQLKTEFVREFVFDMSVLAHGYISIDLSKVEHITTIGYGHRCAIFKEVKKIKCWTAIRSIIEVNDLCMKNMSFFTGILSEIPIWFGSRVMRKYTTFGCKFGKERVNIHSNTLLTVDDNTYNGHINGESVIYHNTFVLKRSTIMTLLAIRELCGGILSRIPNELFFIIFEMMTEITLIPKHVCLEH